jgi:hypothetical protein
MRWLVLLLLILACGDPDMFGRRGGRSNRRGICASAGSGLFLPPQSPTSTPFPEKWDIGLWYADDQPGAIGADVASVVPRIGNYTLTAPANAPSLETWPGSTGGKAIFFDSANSECLQSAAAGAAFAGEDNPLTIFMVLQEVPNGGAAQTIVGYSSNLSTTPRVVLFHGNGNSYRIQKQSTTGVFSFVPHSLPRMIRMRETGIAQSFAVDDFADPTTAAVNVGSQATTHLTVGAQQNGGSIVNFSRYYLKVLGLSTQSFSAEEEAYCYDLWAGNLADGIIYGPTVDVDVLHWGGQSNVQTYNVTGALAGFPRSDIRNWIESNDNYVYVSTALESLGPKDVAGTLYYGPWVEGSAAAQATLSRPMLVTMIGDGGTGIATWLSNMGTPFQNLYWQWRQLARKAQVRFGGNQHRQTIWVQGESDAQSAPAAAAYEANLGTLATQQRALWDASMPIHILELNNNFTGLSERATVRAAQASYVAGDAHAYLIDVDGMSGGTIQGDNLHYNEAGVAEIAALCAPSIVAAAP